MEIWHHLIVNMYLVENYMEDVKTKYLREKNDN